ncbi:MAG: hypothetical protein RMX68_026035 [Aulosira sp. ZfuVER01]|nr:hypothetical protein [Aulosira sp. ZfuVER01]MDZ7999463.1 hypothetical protein [Aulosira sp. DedVER01a]MDZ8054757.1 hypothetical protein [Aulosira sp. ZfuCHP01]
MKCPVCGAVYRPAKESRGTGGEDTGTWGRGDAESSFPTSSRLNLSASSSSSPSLTCRRCKADLSDLIRLHDQAIWYHRQALHLLSQGRYPEAAAHNNEAIALHYSNADFHALAGKLSALQGEFRDAIASWQQALKFDPQNAIAGNCLQMIEVMTNNHHA